MAWIQKYEAGLYDLQNTCWVAKFFKENWTGGVIELQGGGVPLEFEVLNNSDNVFTTIKETQARFSLVVSDNFALRDLYEQEDMSTYVEIFQDEESSSAQPHWTGFIDPRQYEEPYDVPPQEVTVVCVDGLSLLENIVYDEEESFSGLRFVSQIILDVLAEIGITEFKEFINLYEESMAHSEGSSPLDQSKLHVELFRDMKCNEVLNNIFKEYNACIIQVGGVFCIYRAVELIGVIVYGRHFTAATTKTSISISPTQYINRPTIASALRQIPGGSIIGQSAIKKLTIIQDYGNMDSWLKNYKFDFDKFTGSVAAGFTAENWTNNGGVKIKPIHIDKPSETEGVTFYDYNAVGYYTKYISQQFGTYAVLSTTDILCLEFEYCWNNQTSGDAAVTLWVMIKTVSGSHYLDEVDENEAHWHNSSSYIAISETIPAGDSSWTTYKRSITGLPANGPYEARIFALNVTDTGVYVTVGNFRFRCTQDSVVYKKMAIGVDPIRVSDVLLWGPLFGPAGLFGHSASQATAVRTVGFFNDLEEVLQDQLEFTNDINGDVVTHDVAIGDVDIGIDNKIEQFAGGIVVATDQSLAEVAADFDTDHSAAYLPVVVTHSGDNIIFTENDGNDFSGDTSISNISGDLSGTVENTQAHITGTCEIQHCDVSGTSGSIDITIDSVTNDMEWYGGTIGATIDQFISDHATDYSAFQLTRSGTTLVVTEKVALGGFSLTADDDLGDLHGDVHVDTEGVAAQVRIDTITLTGINGTANIVCNGVTREAEVEAEVRMSTSWWSRKDELGDDFESSGSLKPLLEFIGNEIIHQHKRSKQLISMPIQETNEVPSTLNLIGSFRDDWAVDDTDFPIREIDEWTKYYCALVAGVGQQVDRILLSGWNGHCDIGTEIGHKDMAFDTDLFTTAENFVAAEAPSFLSINGVILTMEVGDESSSGDIYLVLVAAVAGVGFTTYVDNTSGSLDGVASTLQPNVTEGVLPYVKYIPYGNQPSYLLHTCDLNGRISRVLNIKYRVESGQFDVGWEGFNLVIYYATVAHGISGSYYKGVNLIADGEWHILTIDMSSLTAGGTDWAESTEIIQVRFTIYGLALILDIEWFGFSRVFTINRGSFGVRNRQWELDLMEVIR